MIFEHPTKSGNYQSNSDSSDTFPLEISVPSMATNNVVQRGITYNRPRTPSREPRAARTGSKRIRTATSSSTSILSPSPQKQPSAGEGPTSSQEPVIRRKEDALPHIHNRPVGAMQRKGSEGRVLLKREAKENKK